MKNCFVGLVALLALIVSIGAAAGQDPAAIIGEWHGTSLCTDRVAAPGCNDEVVIYTFTRSADAPGSKVSLSADKVVNGQRITMGESDLSYDEKEQAWTFEFKNARNHILWAYAVQGDMLTGTLYNIADRKVLRRATATRKAKP
jgi:hypothetical protein